MIKKLANSWLVNNYNCKYLYIIKAFQTGFEIWDLKKEENRLIHVNAIQTMNWEKKINQFPLAH